MTRVAVIGAGLALLGAGPVSGARHRCHRHYRGPHTPTTLFPSLHVAVPPGFFATPPPSGDSSGGGDGPPAQPPAPPPAYPSRTGIDEGEYYVHIAHLTLAAGQVELNLSNFGQDDHDVTIDDADGHQVAQAYLVAGATGQLTPTLAAGTYKVYCSLFNGAHDQAGMHATLTVAG